MFIARISQSIVRVDNVIFEYSADQLEYVANQSYTKAHVEALYRFLITENSNSLKFYQDLFAWNAYMESVLNDCGLCLAR